MAVTIQGPGGAAPPPANKPLAKRSVWERPSVGEWTASRHGKGDPINMYLHGSLDQVRESFRKAGWIEPRANSLTNNVKYVEAAVQQVLERQVGVALDRLPADVRAAVQTMPVSEMTLNGRGPDLVFELDNDPLRGRHHLRVFDSGKKDASGQIVWAVAVVRDTGINFAPTRPEQGFLGHAVDKDTTPERDLVTTQLQRTGMVKSAEKFAVAFGKPGEPGTYSGDGKAVDVTLAPVTGWQPRR